ncbi:MAG: cadherin-like beta sandwich domain-containing protein [Clostridiales bacterium]|nr:cadherin-like beta sandwich domain-containing protein [Candidatus Equinaster intestinalis]
MRKKCTKNLISVVLCLGIILSVFAIGNITASAIAYPCKGTVSKSVAEVWSLPGTAGHEAEGSGTSEKLDTLHENDSVRIIGDGVDGDNDRWYKINYGENYAKTGYIYSGRVKIIAEYTEDKEFESWLTAQKFPESYKPGLRELHSLYPNWVFKADITNIDFQTAVNNEHSGDGKFVEASGDDSKKCMEEGFYDWNDKKYKFTEGTSWVKASRNTLEYYMDPRNFFDTRSIFMFLSQSYTPGTAKAEDVQKVTKGTFMDGPLEDNPNKTYAQVILEAANQFKMNPFVIVGLIRQEQGTKGTSSLISGTLEGYKGLYNYFNVGAYPDSTRNAAQRGLWWAAGAGKNYTTYSRPWNTREKAIKGGVEFSVSNYISVGQDTFYYMNFNVYKSTYNLYTHQYAGNAEDSLGKGKGMANAYADINDVSVEFRIPVFNNMPEKTSLAPTGTNNDCYLKNLSVTGYKSQTFSRYKNSYEYIVPYTASEVEIVAEKSDKSASVSGAGNVKLNVGANEFSVTVTSSSGLKNVYKVSVFREQSPDAPTTVDTKYTKGDYLTGINPATSVADFTKNLGVKNGSVKIFDKSGKQKTSGNIATADKARVYDLNGTEKFVFKVVIYGDVNGDGKISSVDMLAIQKHIFKLNKLAGETLAAADVNHDGNVKSVDMLAIQKHIFKLSTIKQ